MIPFPVALSLRKVTHSCMILIIVRTRLRKTPIVTVTGYQPDSHWTFARALTTVSGVALVLTMGRSEAMVEVRAGGVLGSDGVSDAFDDSHGLRLLGAMAF